jgi:hypothetical protein
MQSGAENRTPAACAAAAPASPPAPAPTARPSQQRRSGGRNDALAELTASLANATVTPTPKKCVAVHERARACRALFAARAWRRRLAVLQRAKRARPWRRAGLTRSHTAPRRRPRRSAAAASKASDAAGAPASWCVALGRAESCFRLVRPRPPADSVASTQIPTPHFPTHAAAENAADARLRAPPPRPPPLVAPARSAAASPDTPQFMRDALKEGGPDALQATLSGLQSKFVAAQATATETAAQLFVGFQKLSAAQLKAAGEARAHAQAAAQQAEAHKMAEVGQLTTKLSDVEALYAEGKEKLSASDAKCEALQNKFALLETQCAEHAAVRAETATLLTAAEEQLRGHEFIISQFEAEKEEAKIVELKVAAAEGAAAYDEKYRRVSREVVAGLKKQRNDEEARAEALKTSKDAVEEELAQEVTLKACLEVKLEDARAKITSLKSNIIARLESDNGAMTAEVVRVPGLA